MTPEYDSSYGSLGTYREHLLKSVAGLPSPKSKSYTRPPPIGHDEKARILSDNIRRAEFVESPDRRRMPASLYQRDLMSFDNPLHLHMRERPATLYREHVPPSSPPRGRLSPREAAHQTLLRTIESPYEKTYFDMDKNSRVSPRHEYRVNRSSFATASGFGLNNSRYTPGQR